MSKADEMKQKMLEKAKRKQEDAEKRKNEERNARDELTQGEQYTYTVQPITLKLADPFQTFGHRKNLDELIGCFFEPEIAKAIKADQKKKGRGWQSHLVNELVKQYYKQKGIL